MNLTTARSLEQLKVVLLDPSSYGPDPTYWVFSNLSKQGWMNLTVIAPGFLSPDLVPTSGELPKTFGHYHSSQANETYHLIEGQGVLMLQKKHLDSNKNWQINQVDEVILINAKPGDEILIRPEWGHSWSNIGQVPLLTYDTWREDHSQYDYEAITKQKGMAYYLTMENRQLKLIPNPTYLNLPQPIWFTSAQWKVKQSL